ncbi:MAG: class I SAM-dependent methyltransferase [Tepidiformaceae bacterium]
MTIGASSVNDSVREQFGAAANAYATSAVHASGPDLAAMVRLAELTGTEDVLDMGSGAGHCALTFGPHVARVRGIDVTPEMVAVANRLAGERALANVSFEQGDVERLPFPDATFDRVTSRLSAHHYADPQRALSEALRVLRPGGMFLLVDSAAPEDAALDTFFQAVEFLRDPSHVRNWRGSEWVRMVASAGFAGAAVRERFAPFIDGAGWVQRIHTPPPRVAMLRELFAQATPAQRAAFDLREEPWGLCIPFVLLTAKRPRD